MIFDLFFSLQILII